MLVQLCSINNTCEVVVKDYIDNGRKDDALFYHSKVKE